MYDVEKFIMERRPIFCKKCGGKLFYQAGGVYQCQDCESEEYDDFGRIKMFLEEHGPAPATEIEEETGVPLEIINLFLRHGRLEILEGSKFYIKCEKCGCALRYGRFCLDCTRQIAGQLMGPIYEVTGEKPKNAKPQEKMRFLGEEHDRKKKKGR